MSKAARRSRIATPVRSRSHQHLGRSLRTILFAPREGFASVAGYEAGSKTPLVLVFLGGAAIALLWLKVGALLGVRDFCESRFLAGYIASTALLGGLIALPASALWSVAGSALGPVLHGERPSPGILRFVWGAAAFPLVVATLVLLPLDLLVVGPRSFTTEELTEPLSTAWAAFSLALGLSAVAWGIWIFLRGYSVTVGVRMRRALAGGFVALAAAALVVAAVAVPSMILTGGGTCPTPPR